MASGARGVKTVTSKPLSVAQKIEAATTTKTQVIISELQACDAEDLFSRYDFEGTALLPRGALTEVLRDIGLAEEMGNGFGPFAQLAFDSHSADSHFLSPHEFKQLYYRLGKEYPKLLPRTPNLKITVNSAKGLPPADANGKSDPFCTMQVVNKPKTLSQTRHIDKTLDPKWGEEFSDKYGYEEGDSLLFEIMDYDKGSTGDLLCSCVLPSKDFHRPGGFEGSLHMTLAPELGKLKGYCPTLKVRVQVNGLPEPPPAVNVVIRHAEGLPPADANGKSDPFCSVMLVGKIYTKSLTTIKPKTLDPVWNEHFTDKHRYEVGDCIVFKIWDYDKTGDNDLLGEVILDSSQFHKPGGFDGELALTCPEPKFAPTLSVKVTVRECEEAAMAAAGSARARLASDAAPASEASAEAAAAAVEAVAEAPAGEPVAAAEPAAASA